jgi:hypothetical protein
VTVVSGVDTGVHGSIRQSDGHASLLSVLPSSQVSPGFGLPLPQPAGIVVAVVEVVVEVDVVVDVVGRVDVVLVVVVDEVVVVEVVVVGTVDVVLVVAMVDDVVVMEVVVVGTVDVVDDVVDVLVVCTVDVDVLPMVVEVLLVDEDVVVLDGLVVVVLDEPSPTAHVTPSIASAFASDAETTVHPNSSGLGRLAPSQSSKWTRKSSPCGKAAPAATSSRSA